MATVNALSVALFNAAAGGYAAEMTANASGFANAVGPILEKDVSTDALFVDHLLGNLGVTSTNAVYSQAKAAVAALVTTKGRAGAATDAVDFLKAQEGSTSAYATIAANFAAKVNAAAAFTAANATERDITKLISGVTGVDTDAAAIAAATAAAEAAAATAAAAAAAKAAADLAAANAAAEAAATAAAAALAAAEAEAAAELAAANAAAEAAATAAAAALAAADAKAAADLAAANATITSLQNPAGTTKALTSGNDVYIGNAGNDTFNGTEANIEGDTDVIVDASSADSDTLNLTGTAFNSSLTTNGAVIRGIENINVAFDSLVQSTFIADGIGDASTITVSQSRSAGSGDVILQNLASGTTVVAGTGVTDVTVNTMTADRSITINGQAATGTITADVAGSGTLTVTANSALTVDATSATGAVKVTSTTATTIDADSTSGSVTVTSGANANIDANTSGNITVTADKSEDVLAVSTGTASVVTVSGEGNLVTVRGKTVTVNLLETDTDATDMTADGVGLADSLTVNAAEDLKITNGGTNTVETITVNGSAALVATIASNGATTYVGDSNVTFKAASSFFTGTDVTGAGEIEISTLDDADLTGVATVTNINVASAAASKTLTVSNNAVVEVSKDIDTKLTLLYTDGSSKTTSTTGVVTVNLNVADISGTIELDTSADTYETLNLKVSTASDDGNLVVTAGETDVVVTGGKALTLSASSTAGSIDASAATGIITATANSSNLVITSGSAADVLTVNDTSTKIAVNSGSGNDNIKVAVAAAGTIAGGVGTDTLTMTAAKDISAATITGIEILNTDTYATSVDEALVNGQGLVIGGTGTVTVKNILSTLDMSNVTFSSTAATVINFSSNLDSTLGTSTNFTVTGTGAVDTITTGNGTNVVNAGAGADVITGGTGVDTIMTGTGADVVDANTGNDAVYGEAGADIINGNTGNDTIDGGADADNLFGAAGTDNITGGTGADLITGGAGADTLTGGTGADTFNYTTQAGKTVAETTKGVAGTSYEVQTVTLSGEYVAGEVLKFTDASSHSITYTVLVGDTATTVAAGITTAIGAGTFDWSATSSKGAVTLTSATKADLAAITVAVTDVAAVSDASVGVSGTSVTGYDTIADFDYTSDTIALATTTTATTATAGASGTAGTTATTNVEVSAGGKVTFAAADDTLAEMITAIGADDTDLADGEVAFFELGSDTYIYIANDTSDATTDGLIKLTGVTGFTTLTTTGGDLTLS